MRRSREIKQFIAYLAYGLQNRDDLLEVADMKDRQNQSNMTEMPITLSELLCTSCAVIMFVRDSHASIKRAMRIDGTVVLKVKESAIRYLDQRLMNNVGIGALTLEICYSNKSIDSHYSELKFFDCFGCSVNDLFLLRRFLVCL